MQGQSGLWSLIHHDFVASAVFRFRLWRLNNAANRLRSSNSGCFALQGCVNGILQVMFCYSLAVFAEIEKPVVDSPLIEDLALGIYENGFGCNGGMEPSHVSEIAVDRYWKFNGILVHECFYFVWINLSRYDTSYAELMCSVDAIYAAELAYVFLADGTVNCQKHPNRETVSKALCMGIP